VPVSIPCSTRLGRLKRQAERLGPEGLERARAKLRELYENESSVGGGVPPLRRPVEMNIAVLSGKNTTTPLRADRNLVLGSDDFWGKITGIPDFRARLCHITNILSVLITGRAATEVARITAEAKQLFDDGQGGLNLDALANPPKLPRRRRP
jgi:hypothetical protein